MGYIYIPQGGLPVRALGAPRAGYCEILFACGGRAGPARICILPLCLGRHGAEFPLGRLSPRHSARRARRRGPHLCPRDHHHSGHVCGESVPSQPHHLAPRSSPCPHSAAAWLLPRSTPPADGPLLRHPSPPLPHLGHLPLPHPWVMDDLYSVSAALAALGYGPTSAPVFAARAVHHAAQLLYEAADGELVVTVLVGQRTRSASIVLYLCNNKQRALGRARGGRPSQRVSSFYFYHLLQRLARHHQHRQMRHLRHRRPLLEPLVPTPCRRGLLLLQRHLVLALGGRRRAQQHLPLCQLPLRPQLWLWV